MARKRMLPTYDLGEMKLKNVEKIFAASHGECYEVEGSLISHYLIDFEGFRVGRVRRKWLVVVEEFASDQSSILHGFLTNDQKIADEFYDEWELDQSRKDKEISDDEYDKRTQGFAGRWYPTIAKIQQKEIEKFLAQFQR